MAIYLAKQNNGAVLPSFAERRINNMMPGEASEVIVTSYYEGFPNTKYLYSIANIQEHCHAQLSNEYLQDSKMRNIFKQHTPVAHMEVPTTSLFFDTLTENQIKEIISYGLSPDASRKNAYSGCIRFENVSALAALGPIEGRFVPGQINFDGALAYTYAIKGMDFFSYVSRARELSRITAIVQIEEKEDFEGTVDAMNCNVRQDYGKVTESLSIQGYEDFDAFMELGIREVISGNDTTRKIETSFVAPSKPSFYDSEDGLVFPYFAGMMLPDKRFTYGVFARLFSKSLAVTPDASMKLLSKIRSGFMSLAFTAAGRAISHAYLGIDLAMNSQSSICFLVEKGQYFGFVLQGRNMRIMYRGVTHSPMVMAELKKQCKELSPLADVTEKLIELVKVALVADGKPIFEPTTKDFSSSRNFVSWFQQITFDDMSEEHRRQFSDLIDKIYFTDRFQIPDQQMILDFLNYVTTGNTEFIAKYPAYIGNSYYQAQDRIHVGLGIFGDRAPSLNFGTTKGDMVFTIPQDLSAVDPNLTEVGEKKQRPLHYLPFNVVAIKTAADQWENLFAKGMIHLPVARKGKQEFTDLRKVVLKIGSDPYFSQAYKLIKEHSSIVRKSLQGGKRKRGNDDSEEGPRASRKKARDENVALAMDI